MISFVDNIPELQKKPFKIIQQILENVKRETKISINLYFIAYSHIQLIHTFIKVTSLNNKINE